MTILSEKLRNKIRDKEARIGIIGMGYVGIPLGLEFANNGFNVLAMRKVKVNPNALGKFARNTKPLIIQFFLVETQKGKRPLETRLYLLRKTVEKEILTQKKKSYICSFSSETPWRLR